MLSNMTARITVLTIALCFSTRADVAFAQGSELAPPGVVETIDKFGSVILVMMATIVGRMYSGTLVADSENPLVVTFSDTGTALEEFSFDKDEQEGLWKASVYADNLTFDLVDPPGNANSAAPVYDKRFKVTSGVLKFYGSITYADHETTVLSGDTYSSDIGEQVQFSDNTELKVDDTVYVYSTGKWYVKQ